MTPPLSLPLLCDKMGYTSQSELQDRDIFTNRKKERKKEREISQLVKLILLKYFAANAKHGGGVSRLHFR